jgi:predicted anti-sigma-YlaC factor YlaD
VSKTCDRVVSYATLAVDGELSELEQRLVETHIARCADCRAFAHDVETITRMLRDAPLEPLARPVTVPYRSRRLVARPLQVAAAALVAVAFTGVLGSSALDLGSDVTREGPTRYASLKVLQQEQDMIVRAGLDMRLMPTSGQSAGRAL